MATVTFPNDQISYFVDTDQKLLGVQIYGGIYTIKATSELLPERKDIECIMDGIRERMCGDHYLKNDEVSRQVQETVDMYLQDNKVQEEVRAIVKNRITAYAKRMPTAQEIEAHVIKYSEIEAA